jgi:hypothetical protein
MLSMMLHLERSGQPPVDGSLSVITEVLHVEAELDYVAVLRARALALKCQATVIRSLRDRE